MENSIVSRILRTVIVLALVVSVGASSLSADQGQYNIKTTFGSWVKKHQQAIVTVGLVGSLLLMSWFLNKKCGEYKGVTNAHEKTKKLLAGANLLISNLNESNLNLSSALVRCKCLKELKNITQSGNISVNVSAPIANLSDLSGSVSSPIK
jgi:hypothetical protein